MKAKPPSGKKVKKYQIIISYINFIYSDVITDVLLNLFCFCMVIFWNCRIRTFIRSNTIPTLF